ncbi:MAG TPA: hypothetical protein VKS79_26420 [Gemmataceae bacterium]|nr:hypothetical protein [Gemmataceae bacterium]
MPIVVECQWCKNKARVPDNAAGKRIRCPKCRKVIEVPAAGKKK